MSATESLRGVGTDIIEIERIREAIARHGERFLDRLFTRAEQEYCLRYRDAAPSFAGRFAAKEAILKSFGTGQRPEITWTEIEIVNDAQGKPEARLSKRLRERFGEPTIFVSISHCDAYATATAIIIGM